MRDPLFLFVGVFFFVFGQLTAAIVVDGADQQFSRNVTRELDIMRSGKRGVVCRSLLEHLELSVTTTSIKPLTRSEETWHPNDNRGTRTHVVALDTLVRDAARTVPTDAILYLNPNHIDPKLSPFRLGTFVHYLALAADLNMGRFSGDFQVRERRAMFFRNAWCDAMGYALFEVSERIPTMEYQMAKDAGFIDEEFAEFFPILDVDELKEDLQLELDYPAVEESMPVQDLR